MSLRNNETEITYEITLRGKEKEQTYDCVLRNFFAGITNGADITIRKNAPLPGGLVHASKENILKKLFDEVQLEAIHYQRVAEECKDEQEKNRYLLCAEALKSLDYDKLDKKIIREK